MEGAAALQQALSGDNIQEKERRLSEMILQLQLVREQLLSQQQHHSTEQKVSVVLVIFTLIIFALFYFWYFKNKRVSVIFDVCLKMLAAYKFIWPPGSKPIHKGKERTTKSTKGLSDNQPVCVCCIFYVVYSICIQVTLLTCSFEVADSEQRENRERAYKRGI